MSRILLADDSPHAQRMGERILRDEGFEVVSLTDGDAVLASLQEADPDVLVADAFLPGKSGFDLCRYIKSNPLHSHMRVVLTAGLLEKLSEEESKQAGADAVLKKPFESSVVLSTLHPLLKDAQTARSLTRPKTEGGQQIAPDPERVRAAVTIALDAALPALIQEITQRVLIALGH
ncbi:MAG TPA: response regulator [Bryobacteraceae bacterium]|nr:response regulator [Bryobacteraceae bacterium]